MTDKKVTCSVCRDVVLYDDSHTLTILSECVGFCASVTEFLCLDCIDKYATPVGELGKIILTHMQSRYGMEYRKEVLLGRKKPPTNP